MEKISIRSFSQHKMKDSSCDNVLSNEYASREYSRGHRLKDKRSGLDILFNTGPEFAVPTYDMKLDKPLSTIPGALKAVNMESESILDNIEDFVVSGVYIDGPEIKGGNISGFDNSVAKYLTVSDHKGKFEVGAIPIYYGFANQSSTEDTKTVIRYNDVEMDLDIKIETFYDRNIDNNKQVAKIHKVYNLKKRNKTTGKFKPIDFTSFCLMTDKESSVKSGPNLSTGEEFTLNLFINSKGKFYAGVIMSNAGFDNSLQPDIYPDPRKDSTRSYSLFRSLLISFPVPNMDNQLYKRYTEFHSKSIYSTMNSLSSLTKLADENTTENIHRVIFKIGTDEIPILSITRANLDKIVESVSSAFITNLGNVAKINVKNLFE